MKKRIKLKGRIKTYLQFSIYLGVLLLVINIGMLALDLRAGILLGFFTLFYFAVTLGLYFYNKPVIINELVSFATQYGQIQKHLLRELELPHALLDDTGKVIWTNQAFEEVIKQPKGFNKSIVSLFPSITRDRLPDNENVEATQYDLTYDGKEYIAKFKRISLKEMAENSDMIDSDSYNGYLIAAYLFDETALHIALQEVDDQSLAVGLLYLDNYEEALESVEEVRRSLLTALIDRKVNKYISALDGIVKKIEKDKYLVIMRKKSVTQLQESRFELLEDVKTVNIGNEMAVTISIGVGLDGLTYAQNYEFSRNAIDLALGRGGDQAVIKTPDSVTYYGGKSQQVEKSTRVKARVKALALREIMEGRENVIIMGHSISDVDSIGAGIGIYCAAKMLGKKAQIVVNNPSSSIKPFIDLFSVENGYPEDLFVDSEAAIDMASKNTLVMVVDTNKPSYTECPELLRKTDYICVFDHHRQGNEVIANPVLSYIEPYASSACEMVAEVLQYFQEGFKLEPREADCIYAGILIDTNNFTIKTGVRTFEAAAYLRRSGAEVTRVRKMIRNDMAAYKARAVAVRDAEVYRNMFAISVCPSGDLQNPTIVGAQAANELLNVIGIKASFVLTECNEKIFISARSIDEINVQIIMERLGGGGHLSAAGAQLIDCNIEAAKRIIKDTLEEMLREGDIA